MKSPFKLLKPKTKTFADLKYLPTTIKLYHSSAYNDAIMIQ